MWLISYNHESFVPTHWAGQLYFGFKNTLTIKFLDDLDVSLGRVLPFTFTGDGIGVVESSYV